MINRLDISLNNGKRFIGNEQVESQIAEVFSKQTKIKLSSGEEIYLNKLKKKLEEFCNDIAENFGFDEIESEEFKRGIKLHPSKTPPGNPECRGISQTHIYPGNIRAYATCDVYINTNIISNEILYFAVLYHELIHHAYNFKKFIDSDIAGIRGKNERQRAINLLIGNTLNTDLSTFCSELMTRIYTGNELMLQGIPWDNVWEYGPGNESLTTGEDIYTESIEYSNKFLKFQINLYNCLAESFGLDSNKRKNQQLTDQAYEYFEAIIMALRHIILNPISIDDCKKAIDKCNTTLQESRSWIDFCHKMGLNIT